LLGHDWSVPEPWGVWSDGEAPELLMRLMAPPAGDLATTLVARGFPGDGQAATLVVNDRPLARLRLKGQPQSYRVRIPRGLVARPLLQLVLRVDAPISPHQLGMSGDGRRLGLGLTSVRLDVEPPTSRPD
jgi:hypothetical protein